MFTSKEKQNSGKPTLSLGHLEALPEHQRRIARLTPRACHRRPERGEMLRLVDDLNKTVPKRLAGRGHGGTRSVRVNQRARKRCRRAFVSNSDISLAGASSRLRGKAMGGMMVGGCVNKPCRIRLDTREDLQSHDYLSEPVPEPTRAHQRGEPHALSLGIQRVPHARAERRRDREIRIIPATERRV